MSLNLYLCLLCSLTIVAIAEQQYVRKGELAEVSQSGDNAICDSVKQYSGYFKLTTGDKNYFYWFFESRSAPATDPVVLWMTGGPGCSSEVALFGENGPCKVNENGTATTSNPYSWNSKANLLYIDQPTGTGFSYGTGLDHNEAGVAEDMYDFLQQFFTTHNEYAALDFFAVGESYAGHYVPAVTHKIWSNNKNLKAGAIKINLKGTSVGNGLTDPSIQYKYYADMAVSTNDHKPAVGSIVHAEMKAATGPCLSAINACQSNKPGSCLAATELCNAGLLIPYTLTGMNPYDMRVKCAKPPLCYDFSNVGVYLGRPEVQKALGVGSRKWSDCNREVALMFELAGDWMHDFQQMIPDQLNDGIRVLIYAGDQDYICNWLGNQAWTLALDWPHKAEFNATAPADWNVDQKKAGELRTSNGFSFLRVLDAGHMVPRDQPAAALDMINSFISGKLDSTNPDEPRVAVER
ncbi:hypothetical protein CYMTET_11358 [Cymbomonas tetramitiformis]|uniref:Carboxypeptidase n=1 Tax=Cymbomonas tetramitiformis TaxID=36881 RepID=A0AAE0GMH1_9CHLO|nr:hypothetical protein CYMTET_11358 [Cymbomonas tetramitiformis]